MHRLVIAFIALSVLTSPGRPYAQGQRGGGAGGGTTAPGGQAGQRSAPAPPRDNASGGQPQTGTARLAGRVLDGATSLPLRRAQITLTSTEATAVQRRVTTTDAEGRYSFDKMPAGRFTVSASKTGFVGLAYGQRRPSEPGTPITVVDAQVVEKIDFSLQRGSVIVARVTDEFGEPVAGVTVQVQRFQYGPDGQRRLTTAQTGNTAIGLAGTDDRGEMRLFGLLPGEYVVQASMRGLANPTGSNIGDSAEGYSPTFYPGTVSADQADILSIGLGEERSIQFAIVPTRLGRITGRVLDSTGKPVGGVSLSLITTNGNSTSSSGFGQSSADGSFIATGIAPGEHQIQATLRVAGAGSQSGSSPVTVGGDDVTGVQVIIGPGATLSGTVVFDGTSARGGTGGAGNPAPLRVNASSTSPQSMLLNTVDPQANGEVDAQGRFRLSGPTGRVMVNVNAPPGWMVRSITAGDDDITERPLELTHGGAVPDIRIVLTDKMTSLSGQVANSRGERQRNYVVVILPDEEKDPAVRSRFTRLVRSDTEGRFEARGLPPGRYVAVALDTIEPGRQFSPEFQERLRPRARPFSLREGQTAALNLELETGLD